jgi:hypothetical protein
MISGVILMTIWLPLQAANHEHEVHKVSPFFLVGAFVDCAQILGLPKFRLRDSHGNPYFADKALLQEPLAIVHDQAGSMFTSELNKQKTYIRSYVRR